MESRTRTCPIGEQSPGRRRRPVQLPNRPDWGIGRRRWRRNTIAKSAEPARLGQPSGRRWQRDSMAQSPGRNGNNRPNQGDLGHWLNMPTNGNWNDRRSNNNSRWQNWNNVGNNYNTYINNQSNYVRNNLVNNNFYGSYGNLSRRTGMATPIAAATSGTTPRPRLPTTTGGTRPRRRALAVGSPRTPLSRSITTTARTSITAATPSTSISNPVANSETYITQAMNWPSPASMH